MIVLIDPVTHRSEKYGESAWTVFYWRVHAMLTALPATRKLDWLSEHFD